MTVHCQAPCTVISTKLVFVFNSRTNIAYIPYLLQSTVSIHTFRATEHGIVGRIIFKMISIETRKLILKIILVCVLHSDFTNGRYTNDMYRGKFKVYFCCVFFFFLTFCKSAACDSNKQLYTEIGCKPIYDNNDGSCPVAYNCGNIDSLPSTCRQRTDNIFSPFWRIVSHRKRVRETGK